MTAKSIRLAALAIFLLILVTVGCTGREQQSERSVDLGGAESVQVRLEMGAGDLTVNGGAGRLAEATFRYSDPANRPVVDYSVDGAQGNLVVRQDNVLRTLNMNERNEWRINLSEEVPLEMDVA